jgi:hypothetical protein
MVFEANDGCKVWVNLVHRLICLVFWTS